MLLRLVLIGTLLLINTLAGTSQPQDLENVLVVVEKGGAHSTPYRPHSTLKISGTLKWRFICSDDIAQETRAIRPLLNL